MRNEWEIIRPEDPEEEYIEIADIAKNVLEFVKDIPDKLLDAGNEIVDWFDHAEEIKDIKELSADERFAVYDELYEKGAISHPEWEDKYWRHIHEAAEEGFEADLESVGLSKAALADLSEDFQILQLHDIETMDKKDELRSKLASGELEPGPAQELADEMLEDGRISKDAHGTISRTIELSTK